MTPENLPPLSRLRLTLANWLAPHNSEFSIQKSQLASVSSRIDDSPGWTSLSSRPHDYDPARIQDLYNDALTAWRKNPIAWRIIGITSDYVVGDHIEISSANQRLNRFIKDFWNHPKNRMNLHPVGMFDLRFIRIETTPGDWETELVI